MTPAPDTRRLIADFEAQQPYALDPFQKEAVEALANGQSVLVSAPTGSGKTVVAEFAVFLALAQGKRCIYTTPLKALSNQKYRDLKEALPDRVGLITGDVVLNPEAPVLVMTTEILRNILHMDPERVADVSQVILDEAHYIGAEGRGTVWEETIVFLGKQTSVTALSATIPNAKELATWVSSVHKDMVVVTHSERPVPLEAYVAVPDIKPLFRQQGRLAMKRFSEDGWVETPDPVNVVKELALKQMLPAIYFVFSRLGCETQAKDVIGAELELTNAKERKVIEEMVKQAVEQTPGMLGSASTKRWLELMPYGVAPHHAGLLPPLKFLIERLFQKGLIKVVFATETLAAGINMPARTVVLSSLMKRTDEGHRMLTVAEFQQMTGRAGRRGMDVVGYGVVVASHRYTPLEVGQLVRGGAEALRSRFTLNYNMVANLNHRYDREHARRIVEQSFSQFQNSGFLSRLVDARRKAQEQLATLDARCPFNEAVERNELLERMKTLRADRESLRKRLSSMETQRQYLSRESAASLIANAPLGSWVVVHPPGEASPKLGVLLAKQSVKSGDIQFSVLLELPAIVRLGLRHLVMAVPAEPVRGLPHEVVAKAERISYLQQHATHDWRPTWEEWKSYSGVDLDGLLGPVTDPPEILKARTKLQTIEEELRAHGCTSCKLRKGCADVVRNHRLLSQEVGRYSQEIEVVHSSHWRQFLQLLGVLEEAGFVRERELLARGHALANLRTTNELLSAETVASGLLEGLAPADLAALTSAMVAEPIRGRFYWRPLGYKRTLQPLLDQMATMAKDLIKIQKKHKVDDQPVYLVTDYVGLTLAWAEGGKWQTVVEESGIDEGQLVRHLRQVIDMLQQFRDIPGLSKGFHQAAREAVDLLDRDIVKEVF